MLLNKIKAELKITFDEHDEYLLQSIEYIKDLINNTILTLEEIEKGEMLKLLEADKTYEYIVFSKVVFEFRKSQDNAQRIKDANPHDYFQQIMTLQTKCNKWRGEGNGTQQIK